MFGMPRSSRLLIVVATMLLLPACQAGTAPKEDERPGAPSSVRADDLSTSLASTTPYPKPKKVTLKAPSGFEPVFAENVARHGSRSLTSGEAVEDAIKLWEEAKAAGALTKVGRTFGPDARALYNAMDEVGFGELNTLGAEEMRAIGAREGERLSAMFEAANAEDAKVDVLDSGVSRAEDSAKNFSAGLSSVHPDLAIEPTESNEKMLKYSGENEKYEDFLDEGPWKDAYNRVRKISKIDTVATEVLEHLYTPEFVAGIDNKLAEASGIFDFYRAGPAQSRNVNVDTAKYMTEKGAETFAYIEDGRYFYSRGPGMEGENDTYQAAQILLDDFFKVIDDRLEGRGPHPHAAVYRFAHAEELTPFAAMLAIPGSDEPGKPGETYTHENNDFRIARVAPLSGSIAWVVWEKGDTHLVSVSHNEVPTTVGRDCELYEDTKNFYELEELRSCLGATD
jgi:hypothetical protein